MGIIRMGPPEELILQLKERYKLKNFIETGTYFGGTAVWAASHFENVITIEYSKEIYVQTVAKYSKIQNINFQFGDTRFVLKTIVPKLTSPAIFWLDSHWCGYKTYGKDDECPLIEEIEIVSISKFTHFIFIDDARLFMSPPPRPHLIEQWPSIDGLIEVIKSGSHKYYIIIFEDVIIAVPENAKEFVANYCQEINTQQWKEYNEIQNMPKISQGLKQINQGLRIVIHDLGSKLKNVCSYKK